MSKITGSHLLVKSLKSHGVDTVFGIAGDHILHLLDVMIDTDFRMIDTRHESAAVHAADSYSRILRRPSVVLSTTPGHANAVPGLANAMHSEAPVVNIAGSAESINLGRGAMQEFDQVGVAAPVCKGAWIVPTPERIPEYVDLAFSTATSGRQGPVHLTIPHDIQEAHVEEDVFIRYALGEYSVARPMLGDVEQIEQAISILAQAEQPMIFAGTGAGADVDPLDLLKLVEATQAPFFSVDSARALIPDSHELSFGLGYLPLNRAAQRVSEADVVLLLGKRLDYTMGYGGVPPFRKDVKIILVDPAPAVVGRARSVEVGIAGSVGKIVNQINLAARKTQFKPNKEWIKSLKKTHSEWLTELQSLSKETTPIHPMLVSSVLREFIDEDTHITFDGGDYCHFIRASIPREKPFKFHNVSSFGMIGVGIAYAIGAQVALPNTSVVLLVGDGSFGFNAVEMDTMLRHNLQVKILLGNNSIWGIDWQIQKGLFGRPVWTDLLPTRWDKVAQGLGCFGRLVTEPQDLRESIKAAFKYKGPALLNIQVEPIISHVAQAAISRKLGSH